MNRDNKIAVYGAAWPAAALGPGRRLVLWTAGCSRRCPRCISPEMQDPSAGRLIPVEQLIAYVAAIPDQLDGITVSGGEPFEQPLPLAAFLEGIKSAFPHWSVIVYSGFTLEELTSGSDGQRLLLEKTDVLVDGDYREESPPVHPLTGSGNQRVSPLTSRGEATAAQMAAATPNQVNLAVGFGEHFLLMGVPDPDARREILARLGLSTAIPEPAANGSAGQK